MSEVSEKTELAVFDFDGTITTVDSMIEFFKYVHGRLRVNMALLCQAPRILFMMMGLADRHGAKEALFGRLFKGMDRSRFQELGRSFADARRDILRQGMLDAIDRHIAQGCRVAVVTASVREWVEPFFAGLPVDVIATEVSASDGRLDGTFSTVNCRAQEKVKRIRERYPECQYIITDAYGDSSADDPMLALALRPHKV